MRSPAPEPGPGRLDGLTVGVDVRYLKRHGVGIRTVVASLVGELSTAGARLLLVTDDRDHAGLLERQYPGSGAVALVPTTWLWWEQVQLARLLWQRRPDVWVAPANYGIPVIHRRSTRCVVVVHDLIPLILARRYLLPRPLWAAMYLVATACALIAANEVVAVSDRTAADIRRLSGRRAQVIYPPIPDDRARPSAGPAPAPAPYVLYHGGIDPRKNVTAMLDALSQFRLTRPGRDVGLVVLGPDGEQLRPLLAGRGLAGCTELAGLVDEDAKWSYLRGAAAVLYPSSYEGFGLVTAEAFAAGVPAVTGTGGALREVGGEAAIYVDPFEVKSIVAGLQTAMEPETRERTRRAGLDRLEALRPRSAGYGALVRSLAVDAPTSRRARSGVR